MSYQLILSGKHRSVTLANELYKRMADKKEYGLKIEHRDIGKDAPREVNRMSFSSEVKEELSRHLGKSRHCQIAELALIAFDGKVQVRNPGVTFFWILKMNC